MKFQKIITGSLTGFFLAAGLACQSSTEVSNNANNSSNSNAAVVEKKDDSEQRLKAVQTADYRYVFVFKRKDGGEFDKEDKTYLKENSPFINRWDLSEDGRTVIAGTNFKFSSENMENLIKRFDVEDYSTIIDDANTNVNAANSNINTNTGVVNKNTNTVATGNKANSVNKK